MKQPKRKKEEKYKKEVTIEENQNSKEDHRKQNDVMIRENNNQEREMQRGLKRFTDQLELEESTPVAAEKYKSILLKRTGSESGKSQFVKSKTFSQIEREDSLDSNREKINNYNVF